MNKNESWEEIKKVFGQNAVDWIFKEIWKRDCRIEDLEKSRTKWKDKYKLLKSSPKG